MTEESGISDQVLKSTLMTSTLLSQNKTLQTIYREIVKKHQGLGRNSCHVRCLMTRIAFGKDEQFLVRVSWPDGLKISIEFVGKNSLIDFLVYICSCVGIWFGISAFVVLNKVCKLFRSPTEDSVLIAIQAQMKKQQLLNEWRFQTLSKKFEARERLRCIVCQQ